MNLRCLLSLVSEFLLASPLCSSPASFENWPAGTGPKTIGVRLVHNHLARDLGLHRTGVRVYPEVCVWYGGLTFAQVAGEMELTRALVARFDPLLR